MRECALVEIGHLLDQIEVLEQDRPVGPDVSECSWLVTGMPGSADGGLRSLSWVNRTPLSGARRQRVHPAE
jgi:hypothetical protein